MTTGIFGGSFNPIHKGHTQLCRELMATGLVDELWLMVSPQNPLKVGQMLLPDEQRLHLTQLAVQDIKGVRVSDYEFRLPRPSYMVHTLKGLRRDYPDREFVLVLGADNWIHFSRWFHYEEILSHHRIIVYPRPGFEVKGELPVGITLAPTSLFDISSTQIRGSLLLPNYDGVGLPPIVWKEIQEKGLYGYGREGAG